MAKWVPASKSIRKAMAKTNRKNLDKFEKENKCTLSADLAFPYMRYCIKKLNLKRFKSRNFIKNDNIEILKDYSAKIVDYVGKHVSLLKLEVFEFIENCYDGTIIRNDRKILNGKELDIYLPDKKLAFEINGTYWHSHDVIQR